MLKRRMVFIAVAFIFIMSVFAVGQKTTPAEGSNNVLSVSSDSLGAMVLDQNIKLMMRDGTYVEGKVIQATREAITVKVKKSEPRDRVAGPEAVLATSDIGTVYLSKSGSTAVPIVLGIAGGFLGGMATAAAVLDGGSDNSAALVFLGMGGGAAGGAILGREVVKKTVTINVLQPQEP